MNYIFISPNFPYNFKHFVTALKKEGVNVLGIGSEPYDNLDWNLKNSLTEYYLVQDLENYEELLKACGYFTHHYGKIDIIESHNEDWLISDARLRTDFNVAGYKSSEIERILKKSEMKRIFAENGIKTAKGLLINNIYQARRFIEEVDYPIILKANIGRGAAGIEKITNEKELQTFFASQAKVEYLAESYIEGSIHSFDGLVDSQGKLIFSNSFVYGSSVFDTVKNDLDQFYYSQKKVPQDIYQAGLKILTAYGIRDRFFSIEFLRSKNDDLIGLEVNFRPPRGHSLDMFNYGSDINVYALYAKAIRKRELPRIRDAKYHVAYLGIKDNRCPSYMRDEILAEYQDKILTHGTVPAVFSSLMGDYYYLLRSQDLEDIKDISGC